MDFDKIQSVLIEVYQDKDYSSSNKMAIKLKLNTPSRAPLILAGYLHNISKVINGDGVKFLKDLGLVGISEIIDEYQNFAVAMDMDQFPGVEMSDEEKEIWKKKTDKDLKYGIASGYILGAFIAKEEALGLGEKMTLIAGSFIPPSSFIPKLIQDYKQEGFLND